MFEIGNRVRLVRHDQYPQLVGLRGTVAYRGDLADKASGIGDPASPLELLYRVVSENRTLYDVPASWLKAC